MSISSCAVLAMQEHPHSQPAEWRLPASTASHPGKHCLTVKHATDSKNGKLVIQTAL